MHKTNHARVWPEARAVIGAGLLLCSLDAGAWLLEGVVTKVSDGDSVSIRDARSKVHKVRLAGIDAPELQQAYGKAAGRALRTVVLRKPVIADCNTQDRYGREVCTVSIERHDLGLALVRSGLAWHYEAYIDDQPSAEAIGYARAQAQAREAGLGLWAQPDPTPPWAWRRARAKANALEDEREVAPLDGAW